jgi:protein involved in polysaccharide export with SLBB domain
MFRRKLAGVVGATTAILMLFWAFSLGIAGPQEKTKSQTPIADSVKEKTKVAPKELPDEGVKREPQISKMLAEYDLKPQPLPSIPDDPPPHEGAMIGLPYVVEPPDLVLVEVLEALPGRPISGERLVRPDGTISIGFYGDVYVKGLTLEQVKVAIIKHLRKFLTDEILGLLAPEVALPAEMPQKPERPPIPELPKGQDRPLDPEEKSERKIKPHSTSSRIPTIPHVRGTRSAARSSTGVRVPPNSSRSRIVRVSTQNQEAPAPAQNPIVVPVGPQGKVTITIELHGSNAPAAEKPQQDPMPQVPDEVDTSGWVVVPPAASAQVFVDITAYNSKNYYILGDVLYPGKLPCTGNETVLDVLQFAGGMLPSAEPKDIRLVRPGRNGKPARVYNVDLAAIQEKGDVTSNYQIFPDDRLIVGRNEVVKKTVEIDRLAAPIQSIIGSMLQEAYVLRYSQILTTNNGEQLLEELVDFWAKEISRPGGVKFDEQTLRDAITRKLKLTPPPVQPTPPPLPAPR